MGVQSGRLRVADACALIGLRRRQVFRLLRGVKQNRAVHLLSRHRGKPSNHRLPDEVRALALSLVRDRYPDFGPTLAAEKLATQHGCSISRETCFPSYEAKPSHASSMRAADAAPAKGCALSSVKGRALRQRHKM
jgi:hypothetical protein